MVIPFSPAEKVSASRSCAFFAVLLWIAVAGYGIWSFAVHETEPPVFDVLTYAQKASNFWDAVAERKLFSPMNLEPTSRPFGTVLISYPFGFSQDFRGFYFRSMFIPLILLAAAVLSAVPRGRLSTRQYFMLCAAAIVLSSAPSLFQFRYDDRLTTAGSWGLVDNALAGIAALAFAVSILSAHCKVFSTALVTALLASLCLLIKPAGMLIMPLAVLCWLVFAVRSYRQHAYSGRHIVVGMAAFVVVYSAVIAWSFFSSYLSAANLFWAKKANDVLKIEFRAFDILGALEMLRVGVGIPSVLLWIVGFSSALRPGWREYAFLSSLILIAGCFFWIVATHYSLVRYFLPFAFGAIIVTIPPLLHAVEKWRTVYAGAFIAILLVPSFGIGALLMSDSPSVQAQRLFGVNLTVNKYGPEVRQANELLSYRARHGAATFYFTSLANPVMAFQSVIDSSRLYHPSKLMTHSHLPIDWARGSAYRMDELSSSCFIVFQPVSSGTFRHDGKRGTEIMSLADEERVVTRWLSSLTEEEGIRVLSETSVRVVEVIDRDKFELAIEKLAVHYQWRPLFLNGYGDRWLSAADISSERRQNLLQKPQEMRASDGAATAELLGVFSHEAASEVIVDVWLKPRKPLPASGENPWFLFFHALDANGQIQQAPQSLYISPSAGKSVRQYRFRLPFLPESGALGVYRPGAQSEFLITDSKDWNGRRVLFSMQEKSGTGGLAR